MMSIKVLIAEDSAFQRKIISEMLDGHEFIDVINMARNGEEAIEMVNKYRPDVLVLDLLMPKVDGLTALKEIMEQNPTPTIIFSVLDPRSLDNSVKALVLGAVDYIIKPGGEWKVEFPKFREELISKVLLAAKSHVKREFKRSPAEYVEKIVLEKPVRFKRLPSQRKLSKPHFDLSPIYVSNLKSNIIVMGASVGGPRTLKQILKEIPKDLSAPILVVQHLNEHFVDQFVGTLGNNCDIKIKVGMQNEFIEPSNVYVSPGGTHMTISVRNNKPCIELVNSEPVNFCKPSIDMLFFSAARVYKNNTLGILLTGMGEDGVDGLQAIQKYKGMTISESKETAILYGMPKIAAERGVVDMIIPNYKIKDQIIRFAKRFN
ncbi:MAG: chemotaxis-specific protein-glutamate methyltransferase CheB [Candidatus Lokiarchaeota archaeon]|nr:chemotaxis-specific protein-glutamate methyltransferase CheB [Candidatus Lokiarchaeota archaeon]